MAQAVENYDDAYQCMPPGYELYIVIDFDENNQMLTFSNKPSIEEWIAARGGNTNFVVIKGARIEFSIKSVVTLRE